MRVTGLAQSRVDFVLQEYTECAFRISIKGGGCSGFKYDFELIELTEVEEDDIIIGKGIVIDPLSYTYLENSELDFKDDVFTKTFVVNNPDVKTTCGCGESIGF